MFLDKNSLKIEKYSSTSQRVRVLTEDWVGANAFCPSCGSRFAHYPNNQPVADFFCGSCKEDFELKSKRGNIGSKINDGSYRTMIDRLRSDRNPNFLLLSYDRSFSIKNFLAIPKYFFTPNIIEKRKPLAESAKRHGWVGCNIVLSGIPEAGKIFYVIDGIKEKKSEILHNWERTSFLRGSEIKTERGWLIDVMYCIDELGKMDFSLDNLYGFENFLASKHPNNKHVKAKIRQQLQRLRDEGYLDFVDRGIYRKIKK